MKRTVFATPRAAEFLELRALQAQTGQPQQAFGHVVVKELIDNALDAAESAGVAPVVHSEIDADDSVTFVTVTDNGAGIAPAVVDDICDFSVLASDKARYRGPCRGAQGNALKTLLGIPFALGVDEPVIIDSCGVRHALHVYVDIAGEVVVEHDTGPGRTEGSAVTVPLPADLEIDEARWAFGTALVNPHATITTGNPAYPDDDASGVFYEPAGDRWSKWTPSCPSSPHWYDLAAFAGLVSAYIRESDRTGVDVPLGKFIAEFDGLSGTAKQKQVRTDAPGVTHLSQLAGRDDLIEALHTAMCAHAKLTPPSRLGPVGPDRFRHLLHVDYWVQRFWYKKAEVTVDGVPWIIEVAVAETSNPGDIFYGVNHGPSFGDPLGQTWLESDGVCGMGASPFLASAARVGPFRAAVVHVICAATQFVDKGKVALVVPPAVREAAAKALAGATKTLRRDAEQRRKDAARADRAARRAEPSDRSDEWNIKEAVFEVLPEAKAAAGDVVSARTLFYKVRPRLQKLTDRELNYSYFTQNLLPEYERTVAPLPGLYYEARGELHHPHDDRVIPLGTREVEAYTPPSWQFDKVLYIEKQGLAAQLAPYRLGQRYDMAFIYGKGYSPTACRNLLARSDIRDMKLFVVHDADLDGYNIARTLANATRRMPDHTVDVVDLGLTVPQAIDAGLETEKFTRKKNLPAELDLDEDARRWFTGREIRVGYDRYHYECTRCELNAFSADQLAEFIETGLQRRGATAKLVPPPGVLAEYVQTVRDDALTDLVATELARMVDVDEVVRQLGASHPDLADVDEERVRDRFTSHATQSWRSVAQQLVQDAIDAADGLPDTARAQLAQQLREEGEQGGGE